MFEDTESDSESEPESELFARPSNAISSFSVISNKSEVPTNESLYDVLLSEFNEMTTISEYMHSPSINCFATNLSLIHI